MVTEYFYLDKTIQKKNINSGLMQNHYTVIKSSGKNQIMSGLKAKQFANSIGEKLSGGSFQDSNRTIPYDFETNYIVINVPKGFKVKKEEPDLIDRLIAYECGEMNELQQESFLDELRDSGLGKHLQGHYSRQM